MSTNTSIEWTETTWNPVTGCTKVSPGCKNCYAERMARRLQAMGQRNYRNGFKLTLQPHMLNLPLRWRSPKLVFVNSMSDLSHKDVPQSFILDVFEVMRKAYWHQFQVLTKRSDRLVKMDSLIHWPANVWMGVSVENEDYLWRMEGLLRTSATVKFLSLEPLLGPLPDLCLSGIDWVIVGGESGPGSRTMQTNWVRDIQHQCDKQQIPFFFKQWGGFNKKKNGRELDGQTYNDIPNYVELQMA